MSDNGNFKNFYKRATEIAPNMLRLHISGTSLVHWNSVIEVPANLSLDEAMEYAKEHIDRIPKEDLSIVDGSHFWEAKNLRFETPDLHIKDAEHPSVNHIDAFGEDSFEFLPEEVKSLMGDISNLRHELDGISGYPYEEELAPQIEKKLFIRECQLCASLKGIKIDERKLEGIELNESFLEEIQAAGSLEDFLVNADFFSHKPALESMILAASSLADKMGYERCEEAVKEDTFLTR